MDSEASFFQTTISISMGKLGSMNCDNGGFPRGFGFLGNYKKNYEILSLLDNPIRPFC